MQTLPFPHTNPLVPTSKRTHIQMHTHSCYHTLITCILLQYVFAEQSLFVSGCLTSFRSLQTVSTNAWCNNYNHMKARASGITQKKQVFHHKLHICYTSHCRREWIRGEVHTGKQLEIKNGTGRGKLLCWQEQSSHYSSYPPGTGRGRAAKRQRLPPSLHWWVCLKGQDRSVNLFHKYECKNLSTIPRKYHENGLFTHYSLILCGGCFKFYALLFQYFIKNFYLNATWICSMTLCQ